MIACVRVLNFALRLYLLDHPECDGEPMVLSSSEHERRIILDCSPEAEAVHLRIGMSIRDMQSIYPGAIVVEMNPAHEAAVSERILTELEALSPFVEADVNETGCWHLDLIGLDRLFGSSTKIAQQLLELMPPLLRPRVGVAETKFASRIAAGRAAAGSFQYVAAGTIASYLATEKIESLPATPAQLRLFRELGLNTLGDLALLPPAAVAARFGPSGQAVWELARGIDTSQVAARKLREVIRERLELEASTASRDVVLVALQMLVHRASSSRQMRGRVARQVLIRIVFESGGSWEKRITLRNPVDGDALAKTLRLRLQSLMLSQPAAELELELFDLGPEPTRQSRLATLHGRDERPIETADQHLKERYASSLLYRVVSVEPWSRFPERRYALMPLKPTPGDTPQALNIPHPIDVESRSTPFQQPEPIAIYQGRQRRAIERITSRWYLNDEWWLRPIRRRYFILLLEGGVTRTVYHDLSDQRWYAQDSHPNRR